MNNKRNNFKSLGLWIVQLTGVATLCTACGGSSGNGSAGNAPAPAISVQPISQTVAIGSAVNFSVLASGDASVSFQWKRNGAEVSGATAASYSLSSAQVADTQSKWSVVVRNAAGSVTSAEATLKVTGLGLFARPVSGGAGHADGFGAAARVSYPRGVAADSAGTIYVASSANFRVG